MMNAVRVSKKTSATLLALKAITGASCAEIVRRAVDEYAVHWQDDLENYWRDEDDHQDAIDYAAMAHGG